MACDYLEHVTALVLDERLAVRSRLADPVGLEAGCSLPNAQQALTLLVHKAAADAFHIGQVHAHQLPSVLGVQASERQAGSIPASSKIPDFGESTE